MIDSLTISDAKPSSAALDFAALRAEGIAYLENVIGALWSDYNVHDPGITLLELLCYGITDIAYRTSFDDADLFAENSPAHSPFVTARAALTCHPITQNDYRRLILDAFFRDVRNVWIEPTNQILHADPAARQLSQLGKPSFISFPIRGLYQIRLQLTKRKRTKPEREKLLADVAALYQQNRLLGEDLSGVSLTKTHPIMVCADIQLAADAPIERTFAAIVHRLQSFLSPAIPRHTLGSLVAQGHSSEDIFQGPALTNGFILEADLDRATTINVVRSSDIIAEILAVPGVVAIPKILLNHAGKKESESELWELPIPLDAEPELLLEHARLRFFKDLIPFHADLAVTESHLEALLAAEEAANNLPKAEDFPIPPGRPLDLGEFTSLQESLPAVYGCGSRGTHRDRSPAALGKAKQLKAFLLIFDQMLANYLGQLVNLTRILSTDRSLTQTLFANAVADIPDIAELLKPGLTYDSLLASGVSDAAAQELQRSKILDHLLARFGETFANHVLMHYSSISQRSVPELIAYKATFLSEISRISSRRATAHDYTDPTEVWDTENVSGFKHRLERLLGFPTFSQRSLADITFDYYEEKDADAVSEIRFRIVDRKSKPKKTLLSGTTRYKTKSEAVAAMRHAIQLGMSVANFDLKQSIDGKWYVVIVDHSVTPSDIVAMRKQFFATREEAAATRDFLAKTLAEQFSEEGSFVLEHILMRPAGKDWPLLPAPREAIPSVPHTWDPYSQQLHIIMPGWGARLADPQFRAFVEQTIRRELPAHLVARVCFISREQMREFEGCYRDWLTALAKQSADLSTKLDTLLRCLATLHTIYPTGTLHDCVEDGDEASVIILGRTHLGSIQKSDH